MKHPKREKGKKIGKGEGEDKLILRVKDLLRDTPLIDGHNDAAWRFRKEHNNSLEALDFSRDTSALNPLMKTDIPKLRAGCVGGQFWSVFVPDAWAEKDPARSVREQIDLVLKLVKKYPEDLELASTADDVERIHASGKIASLIGLEGGHSIEGSLERLREFYFLGARYMTLACSESNALADSATGKRLHGGLSPLGKEVVREMNRLGMLVDLSHASDETMRAVLDFSQAPVIFSHSCARALCNSPRNVPDDILKILAEKNGVIMITFVNMFLREESRKHHALYEQEWRRINDLFPDDPIRVGEELKKWEQINPGFHASLKDVADHIDHACKVAGVDHVGIGSDFGGFRNPPVGLDDVSRFPALLAEILNRGYAPEDIKKIAGENILRVMRSVEDKKEHRVSGI
jgi:membrane dipeptidase